MLPPRLERVGSKVGVQQHGGRDGHGWGVMMGEHRRESEGNIAEGEAVLFTFRLKEVQPVTVTKY